MQMKPSDQYLRVVEWSKEDRCYIGRCPALFAGGVHGSDERKVYRELCRAVEEWVAIYHEDGEPLPRATAGRKYSGNFVLRIEPELHRKLAIEALKSGTSLNQHVERLLADKVKQKS
jgi:predicted HicB family RNase H-like nuclease